MRTNPLPLAAIFLAWSTTALAATAVRDTVATHEVRAAGRVVQKTVVETTAGDTLHTRKTWDIGLLGITVTRDRYTLPSDTTRGTGHDEEDRPQPQPAFHGHSMGLYFAFTGMSANGFDVRGGSSWEWGMYPVQFHHPLSSNERLGATLALGFSRSYYRLKGDGVLQADATGRTVVAPLAPGTLDSYSKPGINYWSWRLPVALEWQQPTGDHPFVSVSLEAELRHHVRSRVHTGHSYRHVVAAGSLDVQPWACNLLVQCGLDGLTIFARVALTDFFGSDSALSATPFAIGIGF